MIFKFPKKNNFLIYDYRGSEILKKIINEDVEVVCSEKLNFWVLLYNLFNLKFSFKEYLQTYINITGIKVLISNIDNQPFLFEIKNCKTIIVQFAHRTELNDLFGLQDIYNKDFKSKRHVDYFFTFNLGVTNEYKKVLNANFNLLGSLINNDISFTNNNKLNKISFVSQYREDQKNHPIFVYSNGTPITKKTFYNAEFKVLPTILSFCRKNNYKLEIIGCHKDIQNEYDFFKKILGENPDWYFQPKINHEDTFASLSTSKLITGIDSTLLYESFARGLKTIFFCFRHSDLKMESYKFGWPNKYDDNGPFWINFYNKEKTLNILNSIIELNQENYHSIFEKYRENTMIYDSNNSSLTKTIDKLKKEFSN